MLLSMFSRFGKYRFLVISIALFIIFDLGVLSLNFYTSGKIAEQTERINLAGRQRTLTQQMSKATLYIRAQKLQQWVYQSGLDELTQYYYTFGSTLNAFDTGGKTTSAETGETLLIKPVLDEQGRAILNNALTLWRGFEQVMSPLLVDTLITDEEILPASKFIAANNLEMFGYMNQLTEHFTVLSERQTNFLRMVQVFGILLATINFFVILFHFIKQLKGRDDLIQTKQHESDQILGTIAEGVFLVDKQMRIGGQHSLFLQDLFQTKRISGRRLPNFLNAYFSQKTVKTAVEYVELYFKKHINPDLIASVNPLKKVKALVPIENNQVIEKYLDFSFALIHQNGDKKMVLVTVNDVTDSIKLELESTKNQSDTEKQIILFSQLSKVDETDLDSFVDELDSGYERLNDLLRNNKSTKDNFTNTLSRLFRETHKLKGGASVVNLDWIVDQLHDFESGIESLQKNAQSNALKGRDLLPLTIKLKSMYEGLEGIRFCSERLSAYGIERGITTLPEAANEPMENKKWFELRTLATQLGQLKGVAANLNLRGFNEAVEQSLSQFLYPVAIQLIRNSIAHGFESRVTREKLMKPNAGQITLSLSHDGRGHYRFVYEDDGRGFDYETIRQTLINQGHITPDLAKRLSKTDLVRRSFSERFSTQENANKLAGRGVGLPLVWNQVQELGGALKIRSIENEFTQFIIEFSNHEQRQYVNVAS